MNDSERQINCNRINFALYQNFGSLYPCNSNAIVGKKEKRKKKKGKEKENDLSLGIATFIDQAALLKYVDQKEVRDIGRLGRTVC